MTRVIDVNSSSELDELRQEMEIVQIKNERYQERELSGY